jgi:hypothetical protein
MYEIRISNDGAWKFAFFGVVLGIECRALCLQASALQPEPHFPDLFALVIFHIGSRAFAWG